jgi:hypothetical protein
MNRDCTKLRGGRRPSPRRRGITLLEVMIAMGVLAVGIMSIASLLPVGRYQMSQAAVFDEASTLGRAAFRDMAIHGYLRPSTWLYAGQTLQPVTIGPLMTTPGTTRSAVGNINTFQKTPPAMPMVLDPLMVALNVVPPKGFGNYVGATTTTQRAVATFPYFLQSGGFSGAMPETSAPQIPRITLRDTPITTGAGATQFQTTIRSIPQGVADRFFRSTDDVSFVVPSANMGLAGALNQSQATAIQFIGVTNAASASTANTTLLTRASHGDYTFFAVISPDFSETWGAPGGYPAGSAGSGGNYNMLQGNASTNRLFNVAVVVCYQRDLRTLTNFTPATTYDRGERMVWVDFLNRGDVRLRVTGVQQAQAQQLLDVKSNQWIMVTGQLTSYAPTPMGAKPWLQTVARWYRVLSVSSQATQDLGSQTTWYRAARVVGPDWTISGASDGNTLNMIYNDANAFNYADLSNSAMPNPPTGWGTIVTGAIAVYEKTINLDDSSGFSY